MKDPRVYLVHVQECIARIERYTAAGREAFLIRVWEIVERDLPALKRAVEAMLRETDPAR